MFLLLSACAHKAPSGDDTSGDACTEATWHADEDGDSFGSADGDTFVGCASGAGFVDDVTDCDDADADVHPGADDACGDGVDDDCSGADRMCTFDTLIDLSTADVLAGRTGDDVGRQISVADLDGDGVDDLFVSTLYTDGRDGGAWVYTAGSIATGDLEDLAWRVASDLDASGAGRTIGTGDVNGDGVVDLSFGAPYADIAGMAVLYGPIDADRSLRDEAVWLTGEASTFCGHGSDLGDLDGDGLEDAVVGAETSNAELGGVYVAYGPLTGDVDLTTAADAELVGVGGNTGRWAVADGDYDGDGLADILVAAAFSSLGTPSGGAAFVVYGPPTDGLDLAADYDGRYLGSNAGEYAGEAIGQGDIDGDGLDDVLVGSSYDASTSEGAAYVFFGPAAGDNPTASADILVTGPANSWLGSDLIARDLDGDGDEDLVVGGAGDTGGAWIFDGLSPGVWDINAAMSTFPTLSGPTRTGTGVEVGDLDGDGQLEVLIGAPADTTNGAMAGAVYVVEAEE